MENRRAASALTVEPVDADTVDIDFGEGKRRVRLPQIDAPESKGKRANEAGHEAAARSLELQSTYNTPTAQEGIDTQYGRLIRDLENPQGGRLSERLVFENHARPVDWTGEGTSRFNRAMLARMSRQPNNFSAGDPNFTPEKSLAGLRLRAPEATVAQELDAGLRRGGAQTVAGISAGVSMIGDIFNFSGEPGTRNYKPNALQRFGEKNFRRWMAEAELDPRSDTFDEVRKGEANLLRYAAGVIGESIPTMVGIMAGGGAGGIASGVGRFAARGALNAAKSKLKRTGTQALTREAMPAVMASKLMVGMEHPLRMLGRISGAHVGGFSTAALLEGGFQFKELESELGIRSGEQALAVGALAGSLEYLGALSLFKGVMKSAKGADPASVEAAKGLLAQSRVGQALRNSIAAAPKGIISEGLTEMAQEFLQIASVESRRDSDVPYLERVFAEDNIWRLAEAAVAGGIFGGALSAAGGPVKTVSDRAKARKTIAEDAQENQANDPAAPAAPASEVRDAPANYAAVTDEEALIKQRVAQVRQRLLKPTDDEGDGPTAGASAARIYEPSEEELAATKARKAERERLAEEQRAAGVRGTNYTIYNELDGINDAERLMSKAEKIRERRDTYKGRGGSRLLKAMEAEAVYAERRAAYIEARLDGEEVAWNPALDYVSQIDADEAAAQQPQQTQLEPEPEPELVEQRTDDAPPLPEEPTQQQEAPDAEALAPVAEADEGLQPASEPVQEPAASEAAPEAEVRGAESVVEPKPETPFTAPPPEPKSDEALEDYNERHAKWAKVQSKRKQKTKKPVTPENTVTVFTKDSQRELSLEYFPGWTRVGGSKRGWEPSQKASKVLVPRRPKNYEIDTSYDSALEFLAKQAGRNGLEGGINVEEFGGLVDAPFKDPKFHKRNMALGGIYRFYRKNKGFSRDGALEILVEAGYLPEGSTHDDVVDLIRREETLDDPGYTMDGMHWRTEEESFADAESRYLEEQERARAEEPAPKPVQQPAKSKESGQAAVVDKAAPKEAVTAKQPAPETSNDPSDPAEYGVDSDAYNELKEVEEKLTSEELSAEERSALEVRQADLAYQVAMTPMDEAPIVKTLDGPPSPRSEAEIKRAKGTLTAYEQQRAKRAEAAKEALRLGGDRLDAGRKAELERVANARPLSEITDADLGAFQALQSEAARIRTGADGGVTEAVDNEGWFLDSVRRASAASGEVAKAVDALRLELDKLAEDSSGLRPKFEPPKVVKRSIALPKEPDQKKKPKKEPPPPSDARDSRAAWENRGPRFIKPTDSFTKKALKPLNEAITALGAAMARTRALSPEKTTRQNIGATMTALREAAKVEVLARQFAAQFGMTVPELRNYLQARSALSNELGADNTDRSDPFTSDPVKTEEDPLGSPSDLDDGRTELTDEEFTELQFEHAMRGTDPVRRLVDLVLGTSVVSYDDTQLDRNMVEVMREWLKEQAGHLRANPDGRAFPIVATIEAPGSPMEAVEQADLVGDDALLSAIEEKLAGELSAEERATLEAEHAAVVDGYTAQLFEGEKLTEFEFGKIPSRILSKTAQRALARAYLSELALYGKDAPLSRAVLVFDRSFVLPHVQRAKGEAQAPTVEGLGTFRLLLEAPYAEDPFLTEAISLKGEKVSITEAALEFFKKAVTLGGKIQYWDFTSGADSNETFRMAVPVAVAETMGLGTSRMDRVKDGALDFAVHAKTITNFGKKIFQGENKDTGDAWSGFDEGHAFITGLLAMIDALGIDPARVDVMQQLKKHGQQFHSDLVIGGLKDAPKTFVKRILRDVNAIAKSGTGALKQMLGTRVRSVEYYQMLLHDALTTPDVDSLIQVVKQIVEMFGNAAPADAPRYPMRYEMAPEDNIWDKQTTTIAEIIGGNRTSTTRGWGKALPVVGQRIVFEHEGTVVGVEVTAVTEITPEAKADPEFRQQWQEKEGWIWEKAEEKRYIHGHQVEFKKLEGLDALRATLVQRINHHDRQARAWQKHADKAKTQEQREAAAERVDLAQMRADAVRAHLRDVRALLGAFNDEEARSLLEEAASWEDVETPNLEEAVDEDVRQQIDELEQQKEDPELTADEIGDIDARIAALAPNYAVERDDPMYTRIQAIRNLIQPLLELSLPQTDQGSTITFRSQARFFGYESALTQPGLEFISPDDIAGVREDKQGEGMESGEIETDPFDMNGPLVNEPSTFDPSEWSNGNKRLDSRADVRAAESPVASALGHQLPGVSSLTRPGSGRVVIPDTASMSKRRQGAWKVLTQMAKAVMAAFGINDHDMVMYDDEQIQQLLPRVAKARAEIASLLYNNLIEGKRTAKALRQQKQDRDAILAKLADRGTKKAERVKLEKELYNQKLTERERYGLIRQLTQLDASVAAIRDSKAQNRAFIVQSGSSFHVYIPTKGRTRAQQAQDFFHEFGHVIYRARIRQMVHDGVKSLDAIKKEFNAQLQQYLDGKLTDPDLFAVFETYGGQDEAVLFEEWAAERFAHWAQKAMKDSRFVAELKAAGATDLAKSLHKSKNWQELSGAFKQFVRDIIKGIGTALKWVTGLKDADTQHSVLEALFDGLRVAREAGTAAELSEPWRRAIEAMQEANPGAYLAQVFSYAQTVARYDFDVAVDPFPVLRNAPLRNSVGSLRDSLRNWYGKNVQKRINPHIRDIGAQTWDTSHAILQGSANYLTRVGADDIRNLFQADVRSGGRPAIVERTQHRSANFVQRLVNEVFAGASQEEMNEAHAQLRGENIQTANLSPLAQRVRGWLNEAADYMREGPIADAFNRMLQNEMYFPRLWDFAAIEEGALELVQVFMNPNSWKDGRELTEQEANELVTRLRDKNGEFDMPLDDIKNSNVLSPAQTSSLKRELPELKSSAVEGFVHRDNLQAVMVRYTRQMVARAEYDKMASEEVERKLPSGRVEIVVARGKKLRKMLEKHQKRMERGEITRDQYRRILYVVRGWTGALQIGMPPQTMKLFSSIRLALDILLLPLATLSSLPELANVLMRSDSNVDASWKGLKEAFTNIRNESESALWQYAESIGIVQSQLLDETVQDRMDLNWMTQGQQKIASKFFRGIGLTWWTNKMRMMAASTARAAMKSYVLDGKEEKGRKFVESIGLKWPDVVQWVNDGAELVSLPARGSLNDRINFGIQRFVQESVFAPNMTLKPAWGNNPWFALVIHLKSFMFGYYNTIVRGLGKQLGDSENMKDAMVAVLPILPLFVLGAMSMWLRDQIKYAPVLPWRDPQGKPDFMDRSVPQYITAVMQRTGILGPLDLVLSANQQEEWGGSFILSTLGPAASTVDTFRSSEGWNAFFKMMPGFSIMTAERMAAVEALRGDGQ